MNKIFDNYIHSIVTKFSHPETSEMGYRTDFEILLSGIFEKINVRRIDHDARTLGGNKPDFIVMKYDVPILYVEAKDIGISLDKIEKSEQMARYFGYTNLILTDYVEFRFYRNGFSYQTPIKIAEYDLKKRKLSSIPENFELLTKTIIDFAETHKEPIRTAEHLSKIMGGKAQRIRDNVMHFLSTESEKNVSLLRLYDTIKRLLVHDITKESFADMYAQTLVYGLFVARYHDDTTDNFTRQKARDLVPKSNPLLRHFFDHILGADYDERLKFIIDELCFVFSHANVHELMKQYFKNDLWGKKHEGPDPVIHFYEDFLKEYDPGLRKKLGAYYTPLPVVRFIIRSVDYLLEKEFGLSDGLADTAKTEKDIHQVQILDPATGTGTFITEILKNIYARFTNQKGRWPKYVFSDLLPRLHGFELMMAPYTIAHLKVSMMLKDSGFKYFNNSRLGIYLTNSLEESNLESDLFGGIGFAESIAEESKDAAVIKNKSPIMVVVGNPPYSISSSNKGDWILNLIKIYKKDLHEQKINLDDDYIKFIRFAEHFIEKNRSGIVAMITNNSFIDGVTHRQMRKHLLETFDNIYIYDLHGSSKKMEKDPEGGKDENVFDIMQGVSINIFVRKNADKNGLGNVFHSEIFGKRINKFETLDETDLKTIKWKKLEAIEPYYFFVPKDFDLQNEYNSGFKIEELFLVINSGIKTDRDSLFVDMDKPKLKKRIQKLLSGDFDLKFKNDYRVFDSSSYNLTERIKSKDYEEKFIQQTQYRPFDYQWIYYDPEIISRPGKKVFEHIVNKENISLLTCRQESTFDFQHIFVSNKLVDICTVSLQTKETGYVLPLYLYNNSDSRIPNLKPEIVKKIEKSVGKVEPENLLDYIYAVLHTPTYRLKYKEFLKIDFPRIPYPKNRESFISLVNYGNELRLLHLLEAPKLNKFSTTYSIEGSDIVERISYQNGNVYINSEQFFGNVPGIAWNFYIGGYLPAQKWLKDRKGRSLTNEEIEHYQKIIVALTETDRIMKEIDKIEI